MEPLLLDTNVVSFLMRGHTFAEPYRRHLEGKTLAISFMTVGEMYEGARRRGWGQARMAALETRLRTYLVVPYSFRLCQIWGRIRAERRSRPIAVDDAWIAATAIAHDCPLVTHNPGDFTDIRGLTLITEA